MFTSFKKLFRKDTEEDLATSIPAVSTPASATHSSGISGRPVTLSFTPPAQHAAPVTSAPSASHDMVVLPIQSIIARLPNSLAGVVQSQGNGSISLPALWVVQELPKGSVKISFGELRQIAPPGTFFENIRHDQVLIELPLNEILTRIHPSHLSRRQNQRQIVIPNEITNVFGPRGEGISLSSSTIPKPAKPAGAPIAIPQPIQSEPLATPAFKPAAITPSVAPKIAVASLHALPVQPAPSAEFLPVPLTALQGSWPESIQNELSILNQSKTFVMFPLNQLEPGLKAGKIIFSWKQVSEWIQPPVSNSGVGEDTVIELPLHLIAPLFMANRQPKAQKKVYIGDAPDLFTGKIEPVVEEQVPIVMAAPVVPMAPIKMAPSIIPSAPIKMAPTIVPSAPIKMAAPVAPIIPAPIASAAPVATITPIAPEAAPEVVLAPAPAMAAETSAIGEILGQPSKHDWTPNEIVKGLVTLPNIAGAFVAMTDGLLVTAELPSHLRAETVAAFLPQIFGRVNQYTKELQLGAISSFSFVVENVSWQIIKSKTVYLVAIGKSGEALPGSTLNTIAAELGKQIQ